MPVGENILPIEYMLNGVTLSFPLDFYFISKSHLKIVKVLADETAITQVINVDYNISGEGNTDGGSLILNDAGSVGQKVIISWDLPFTQDMDLKTNDKFPADRMEMSVDLLTQQDQQLLALLTDSLKLGAARIAFDAANKRIENVAYPQNDNDVATRAYVNTITAVAGNVPIPTLADVGKFLKATATGAFAWVSMILGALAYKNTISTGDIDNNAVSYAKLQNISDTNKILGRSSSGAGIVQEITCTAAGRALLDDADATEQLGTLGATAAGKALFTATDNAAQRTALGLGSAAIANTGTTSGKVPLLGVNGSLKSGVIDFTGNNTVAAIDMGTGFSGLIIIGNSALMNAGGIANIRDGNSGLIAGGTNFAVTTGVLNGSTGTAGKVTVSASGNIIYIENRTGFANTTTYLLVTTI